LQNRQGKTRLSRWYIAYNEQERRKIEIEVHRNIVQREAKHTNFLEVVIPLPDCAKFRNHKIVYRRYAGLYFTLCID